MNRRGRTGLALGGQNAQAHSGCPVRDVDGDAHHRRFGPAGRNRTGGPARRPRLIPWIPTRTIATTGRARSAPEPRSCSSCCSPRPSPCWRLPQRAWCWCSASRSGARPPRRDDGRCGGQRRAAPDAAQSRNALAQRDALLALVFLVDGREVVIGGVEVVDPGHQQLA